jgi:hypothetical protein
MKQSESYEIWVNNYLENFKKKLTGIAYIDKTIPIELQKTCSKCGVKQDISNYYLVSKAKGIYPQNPCISCVKKYQKDRYQKIYEKSIIRKFDLNSQEYNKMLEDQEYSCKICNTHIDKLSKNLAVDHCHITGKVRGLLCSKCNTGIGMLKDDIKLLEKALQYLKSNT